MKPMNDPKPTKKELRGRLIMAALVSIGMEQTEEQFIQEARRAYIWVDMELENKG
jgi:hypothetical protein